MKLFIRELPQKQYHLDGDYGTKDNFYKRFHIPNDVHIKSGDKIIGETKKEARIIVCGSRAFNDYAYLRKCLDDFIKSNPGYKITIVSGTAAGADKLGEQYALNKYLLLKRFPAKWNVYGKSAGYIRNAEMLDYAMADDAEPFVMAFWDGESHGTKQMVRLAKSKNVKTIIHKIEVVK